MKFYELTMVVVITLFATMFVSLAVSLSFNCIEITVPKFVNNFRIIVNVLTILFWLHIALILLLIVSTFFLITDKYVMLQIILATLSATGFFSSRIIALGMICDKVKIIEDRLWCFLQFEIKENLKEV